MKIMLFSSHIFQRDEHRPEISWVSTVYRFCYTIIENWIEFNVFLCVQFCPRILLPADNAIALTLVVRSFSCDMPKKLQSMQICFGRLEKSIGFRIGFRGKSFGFTCTGSTNGMLNVVSKKKKNSWVQSTSMNCKCHIYQILLTIWGVNHENKMFQNRLALSLFLHKQIREGKFVFFSYFINS